MRDVARNGKLRVLLFCAGGIATPAGASLVMRLGAVAVFVGSGIFNSSDSQARARAVVAATTHFVDPEQVAAVWEGLGAAMQSLDACKPDETQLLANRGW